MLKVLMEKVEELEKKEGREGGQHFSSFANGSPGGRPALVARSTEPTDPSQANTFSDELIVSLKPSLSGYLPCHYFDYIGGTSTGG